jgi:hypothetical protein
VSSTDATSFTNWQACVETVAAAEGECSPYVVSADCVGGEDASPAAACVTGQSFEDDFLAIAGVFCG